MIIKFALVTDRARVRARVSIRPFNVYVIPKATLKRMDIHFPA